MFSKSTNQSGYQHFLLIAVFLIVSSVSAIIAYTQPSVPKPVFQNFQAITLSTSKIGRNNYSNLPQQQSDLLQSNTLPMGANAADIMQKVNQNAMQTMGVTMPGLPSSNNQHQQIQEAEQDLKVSEYQFNIQRFQQYLTLFEQLNPDSFSISKAVYLSEAVYDTRYPSYEQFVKDIKQRANVVKLILKQEGLSIKNASAVNYAIQKLFSQDNIIHDSKTGKDYLFKKIRYDFDDFYGEKDWKKTFVSKVLQFNLGQCHSLPLLYLCIAEQLDVKAYLSLAPNHSFIRFLDSKGKLHNFETTNGHIVSSSWLLQSDAISATAYKNKTYLDTLSSRKLFAESLADFQMCYIMKNDYDNFSVYLSQKILAIDSTNINALMTNANNTFYKFHYIRNTLGNPPQEQWSQFPQLEQAYNDFVAARKKVTETGYQDMPKEQYIQWVKSIDREKQKINKSSK